MKGPFWERLAKQYILPDLPGFAAKGKVMFRAPIGMLLHCFALGDSVRPDGAYVSVIVQPLFDPVSVTYVTYGRRLGWGARFWDVDPADPVPGTLAIRDAMLDEGLPFLAQTPDIAGFAKAAEAKQAAAIAEVRARTSSTRGPFAPYGPERVFEIAGSYIWMGNQAAAEAALAKLTLNPPGTLADAQSQKRVARCDLLSQLLVEGGLPAARGQLLEWRRFTLANLRLERWADPNPA